MVHKLQQIKNSPQDHPLGHTKIQKAGPAAQSNARAEFRRSSAGVTQVVSASDLDPYYGLGTDTRDLVLGRLTLALRLMLP